MRKKILRVLEALEEESNRQRRMRLAIPRECEMLAITWDTGLFFSILIKALRARSVLEIGTSSGYSTLWIADALLSVRNNSEAPTVTTIESEAAKVKWASDNFRAAGIDSIATIMEGNAITILPQLRATKKRFDFVLIDADKENIVKYFDLILPMVRARGIIAADNMLIPIRFRPQMKKYAAYVRSNPSVQSVTVPIGMGEEITLKLS